MLTDAKVANNVISESVRFFVVVFTWNEQESEINFQPSISFLSSEMPYSGLFFNIFLGLTLVKEYLKYEPIQDQSPYVMCF